MTASRRRPRRFLLWVVMALMFAAARRHPGSNTTRLRRRGFSRSVNYRQLGERSRRRSYRSVAMDTVGAVLINAEVRPCLRTIATAGNRQDMHGTSVPRASCRRLIGIALDERLIKDLDSPSASCCRAIEHK